MRNTKIDLLRFIGLTTIVLAHSGLTDVFILQLRNFDVPLMVLASGMSFGLAFKGHSSYAQYIWKRIKRLLFPVWIFLTIYFTFQFVSKPSEVELNLKIVLQSYLLLSGIGYVWIIRVFLLIALAAPIIYSTAQQSRTQNSYLIKLLSILVIYEICRWAFMPYISTGYLRIVKDTIFYIIPYSVVFALGLKIPHNLQKSNLRIGLFCWGLFLILAFHLWYLTGSFIPTNEYKYPPSIYYFSYAIAVSIFLWITSNIIWKIIKKSKAIEQLVLFVAQNSMWIYLWHIPLARTIEANFFLKFSVMFLVSISITFLQVWIVNDILIPKTVNTQLKRNLKILLTG